MPSSTNTRTTVRHAQDHSLLPPQASMREGKLPCKRRLSDLTPEERTKYAKAAQEMFGDDDTHGNHKDAIDEPGVYRVLSLRGLGPLVVFEDAQAGPGGRLWDASVALARYVAESSAESFAGVSVVEIGAGTGAPGMVAALRGATVTLTDRPRMACLLGRNCAFINQAIALGCGAKHSDKRGHARYAALEWGGSVARLVRQCGADDGSLPVLPCHVVLASDVVGCGDHSLFPPLIKTLCDLTSSRYNGENPDATQRCTPRILMSYRKRAQHEQQFFELMLKHFTLVQTTKIEIGAEASDFEACDDGVQGASPIEIFEYHPIMDNVHTSNC